VLRFKYASPPGLLQVASHHCLGRCRIETSIHAIARSHVTSVWFQRQWGSFAGWHAATSASDGESSTGSRSTPSTAPSAPSNPSLASSMETSLRSEVRDAPASHPAPAASTNASSNGAAEANVPRAPPRTSRHETIGSPTG